MVSFPTLSDEKRKSFLNFVRMKRISTLLLAFLIFTVSVGLPIYSHTCLEEGIAYTSLIHISEKDCCEKETALPSCCQKKNKKCCSQETTFLKLKVEGRTAATAPTPNFSGKLPALPWIGLVGSTFQFKVPQTPTQCRVPHVKYGKYLRAFIGFWRI